VPVLSLVLAITLAQVQTALDTRLGVVWPNIQAAMATCLASSEGCYTTWSASALCNTVTADSITCSSTQDDPGIRTAILTSPTTCSVSAGVQTFASYGITLPATDLVAYRISTYNGPGGKGAQVCARAQFNGTTYERCQANGPQAAAFTRAWQAVLP
jgi:hypothetical protein